MICLVTGTGDRVGKTPGELNAAALTLEAVRSRVLGFAGFVANHWPASPNLTERTTFDRLNQMGRVIGVIPEVPTLDTRTPASLPSGLELRAA